jgi:hypothetical protein
VDAVLQPAADAGLVLCESFGSRVRRWPRHPHGDGLIYLALRGEGYGRTLERFTV